MKTLMTLILFLLSMSAIASENNCRLEARSYDTAVGKNHTWSAFANATVIQESKVFSYEQCLQEAVHSCRWQVFAGNLKDGRQALSKSFNRILVSFTDENGEIRKAKLSESQGSCNRRDF